MQPVKPMCIDKTHGNPIELICLKCKQLMCVSCMGLHYERGCKGAVVDLPFYANLKLMSKLRKTLAKLESNRQKVEDTAREFTGALPEIEKGLRLIKGKTEKLLEDINNALAVLKEYGQCSASSAYITIKRELEQQLKDLPSAVEHKDVRQIMKAISANNNSMSDRELRIRDTTISSLNKVLLGANEFDALGTCLQELVGTCQNVLSRKLEVDVISRFVYGVCNSMNSLMKLCRYDIVTKKIAPCVAVPQYCSILQIGKQIFISGGYSPMVNTLSELLEEAQSLVSKKVMTYTKGHHTSIAISETQFMTIGGCNSGGVLAYCEEYSIQDNTWKVLPLLNQARYDAAAALSADRAYLYVIGGNGGNNLIERMDMKERRRKYGIRLLYLAQLTYRSEAIWLHFRLLQMRS